MLCPLDFVIFAHAGLDSMAALMNGQGITEANVLIYMSLIEQRAIQIVTAYSRKLKAMGAIHADFLGGPQRPAGWEVRASTARFDNIHDEYAY